MQPQIHTLGIKEMRTALRNMDAGLARQLTKTLKAGAEVARPVASRLEPRGRTGRLAASVRAGAAGPKSYLRSSLIYAGPHEFGGRVGIHKSVRIHATAAMQRGIEDTMPQIIDVIGDGIDDLAQRNGF